MLTRETEPEAFLGMGRGVEAKRCAYCVQADVRDHTAAEVLVSEELLRLTASAQKSPIFYSEKCTFMLHTDVAGSKACFCYELCM